jgi:hypothetical protein
MVVVKGWDEPEGIARSLHPIFVVLGWCCLVEPNISFKLKNHSHIKIGYKEKNKTVLSENN